MSSLSLTLPSTFREGTCLDVRLTLASAACWLWCNILHISELRNFPSTQPKNLAVGTKAQRPSNVPSHLPAFPDPHTYIKTPVSNVMSYNQPGLPNLSCADLKTWEGLVWGLCVIIFWLGLSNDMHVEYTPCYTLWRWVGDQVFLDQIDFLLYHTS